MNPRVEQVATGLTYAASGATTVWGFNAEQWGILGIIVGIVLGIGTFIVNLYYKQKHLKIAEQRGQADPEE